MSGPYATEQQVTVEMKDVYANYHKRGVMRAKIFDRLLGICAAHGLELGAYDREVLRWLAQQKPETAQVIGGLVQRASTAATSGDGRKS